MYSNVLKSLKKFQAFLKQNKSKKLDKAFIYFSKTFYETFHHLLETQKVSHLKIGTYKKVLINNWEAWL